MVSIGSEIYANVWSPEALVSKIHIGKLKGHTQSIACGTYLGKSPYFVTIDISNKVIIWDIKNFVNVQTFSCTSRNSIVGMIALSKNCFWPYNKRFMQIDNISGEDEAEHD